ncbi:MAG: hypothetical protein ACJAWV_001615 [Flammeovirgaceae bacterium]|jgi:hypothetical protein
MQLQAPAKKAFLLFLLLTLFIFSNQLLAQRTSYELGLNPSKLKWKQIKTDKVQVIFPSGLEFSAQRVANLVHFLSDSTNISIGKTSGRVSIILQTQTTIPNGFVSLTPFRSEFFMTPPQFNFSGSTNWADLLTIHEYRHVKQALASKVGVTKAVSLLFGQNGWAFMKSMALPRWYSEGDAVAAETGLTATGRGRTPEFDMEYRALRLENRDYNYEKASAGSLKDFVPSHYQLGYNLITYGRKKYGKNVWGTVLEDAGRYKGVFYPFSRNLKKETGLRTPEIYRATMQDLDSLYQSDLAKLELTTAKKLNTKPKKKYTSYRNAHFLAEGKIVVEKSSFDQIRTYYLMDLEGNEEKMILPGLNLDLNSTLSVANGKMAWAELTYHPRWFEENYSIIRTNDARSVGTDNYSIKKNKITSKTKLFAPDLSSDARQIVAVKIPADLTYSLVILDADTGEELRQLPNPEKYFFAFPQWAENDKSIISVVRNLEQSALAKIDAETGAIELLTEWSYEQITNPFPTPTHIFFAGSHTGINNIFALDLATKKTYQVTSTKLGAYQPSISSDSKQLIYSEFTSLGYDLMLMDLKESEWREIQPEKNENVLSYYKVLEEQEGGSIVSDIPNKEFEVSKFNKISGLVNLHSWNPVISDAFDPEGGIEVLVDNKIKTFSAIGGYLYNGTENTGKVYGEVAYGEFVPILRAGFSETKGRNKSTYSTFVFDDTVRYGAFANVWDERVLNAGVTIPLNLTSGNAISDLELSGDFLNINRTKNLQTFIRDTLLLENPIVARSEKFNALAFQLDYSVLQTTALQNILPKLGFTMRANYRTTLGDGFNQSNVFFLTSRLFLPGFAKNHSLHFSAGFQTGEKKEDFYRFTNRFAISRGYALPTTDGISRFSANYTLPLFYPDLAIGSFAFIKRVKANVFYDITQYKFDDFAGFRFRTPKPFVRSAGVELTTDLRTFRLLEIDLGVRYTYRMDEFARSTNNTPHLFEFLLIQIGG